AIEPFGQLGRSRTAAVGGQTFLELQSRGDEHFAHGRRYYSKGGFLGVISDGVIEAIRDAITASPTPDSEAYCMHLGGGISDIDEDATAYSGRNAGFYWIVEPVWGSPDDDRLCLAWGREAAHRLAALSLAGNYINEQADVGVALSA